MNVNLRYIIAKTKGYPQVCFGQLFPQLLSQQLGDGRNRPMQELTPGFTRQGKERKEKKPC